MKTMTPYQLHKQKWSSCTRCPLHETRKNVVLVRGKLPADVLFVGEAPGTSEDALGKPFVGPAGKLLDRIVEDAGGMQDRIRLAFTNVLACIPYDEDGKKVSEPKGWPPEAIRRCSSRLSDMIDMARPNWVVAVGSVAARELEKDDNRVYRLSQVVHPAAILRANPAQQGLMYQKCVVQLAEIFENLLPF